MVQVSAPFSMCQPPATPILPIPPTPPLQLTSKTTDGNSMLSDSIPIKRIQEGGPIELVPLLLLDSSKPRKIDIDKPLRPNASLPEEQQSTSDVASPRVNKLERFDKQSYMSDNQPIKVRITQRMSHNSICSKYRRRTLKNIPLAPHLIEIPTGAPRPSMTKLPSFLLLSACHLSNKTDELSAVVAINNPSVVLITESWLSEAIPDSAVTIGPEFKIFRLDRATAGGGVLTYVHSSILATSLVPAEASDKEVLWLLLNNNNNMTEYLITCLDSFLIDRPSCGQW